MHRRLATALVLSAALPLLTPSARSQSGSSPVEPLSPAASQEVDGTRGGPCNNPPVVRKFVDPSGLNLQNALTPHGLPFLGNANFFLKIDDAMDECSITPGADTYILIAEEPFVSVQIPNAGCTPGTAGTLIVNVFSPTLHVEGPVVWGGPGMPACHPLPIRDSIDLCGLSCLGQGLFVDSSGAKPRFVLTEPLRMIVGS